MELKYLTFALSVNRITAGSNRTFMELKLYIGKTPKSVLFGSNRTFMELKYLNRIFYNESANVLIVPLWN